MPKLPNFLTSLNYQNLSDRHHALFQYANNTNLNLFEWMQHHPEQLARFSATMTAATQLQAPSLEAIILSLLPKACDPLQLHSIAHQDVLLVDIGGGRGQVIYSIRNQRPDLRGRIIVQDLPQEISGREPVTGIEAMAHDFFTPQPIHGNSPLPFPFPFPSHQTPLHTHTQPANPSPPLHTGAHIYLLSHILHDWPDAACRDILLHTLPALTPGVSKIIIIDIVLPEVGASPFACMMDISMMAFGGMERTERQWRGLLEGVGLRVVRIEGPGVGSLTGDSVIEAVAGEG